MKSLCRWPGCTYEPDHRLGLCYPHWTKLPKPLRDAIYATYREGWAMQPRDHREALSKAFEWVAANIYGTQQDEPPPTVKRLSRSRP